jgi:hypothetical protein
LPSVAAAPRTLEPWAQQSDRIDRSLSPRQSLSVRSLLTYVGLAAALVLMLGSIALLTRSGEPGEPASKPPPPAPDSLAMTPPATALDPEMSRDASAKPEADPREAAAPKAGALEPGAAEPGAAELAPEADTSPDAPVAVASSIPASPGGRVTVTIRTSPPGAIIYDEKQRIGKGVARINMQPGRKRSMLALLNLHHPRHFVLDGSETTVNITLEPMDANAIARAIAVQKHKATHSTAPTKRTAR